MVPDHKLNAGMWLFTVVMTKDTGDICGFFVVVFVFFLRHCVFQREGRHLVSEHIKF